MTEIWSQAALWLGLTLIATLASIRLRVATALSEIVVGTIAQLIIGAALGGALLAGDASWLKFLAGAELDLSACVYVTSSQQVTRAQALQKSREFQSELELKFARHSLH